ncbi:AraC family transcriptional regulator [Stutzerimonas azotifigens]|uniref:AraC family transcriptional regulator n=1 Tax=Stutzerimonas azotifigens TaxID=291995 RepID=A0ABR5Z6F3_9GAMM|nr:helix-turn-helix transcriptional regulator [Stutzerimonas azotifigens]MBA1275770.1 AraC family transcriptional regulator [Stutzerimonas azotifigens]
MSPIGQQALAATQSSMPQTLPRPVYGKLDSPPNLKLGYRHSHPWVQISHAVEGVLEVRTDGGRFIAPPLRAVWVPAGVTHQVFCAPDTCIRSLYIDRSVAGDVPEHCRVLQVSPLLRELIAHFSTLAEAYDEQGPDGRLVQVLLDQLGCAPEVELMLPLPADPRLHRLCKSLQARPEAPEGLAEWSQTLGVSERTLSRLFLRETGLTFRAWRQRLRLLSALPALERGERVTDVALSCGYESLSAFIAAFREQFGATPGEFFRSANRPVRDAVR